jgi:hypothetical protein
MNFKKIECNLHRKWMLLIFLTGSNFPTNSFGSYYSLDISSTPFLSSISQSGLNIALTPADRIVIHQGHFFTVGTDGQAGTADDKRMRLYGVNLAYSANFPEPNIARQIAQRIRSLGFNAVRLHHMDSVPDSDPELAHSILTEGPFPTFNLKTIDRLKQFLRILKEEGIYVNLNLYVGYRFRPTIDHVPALMSGEYALSAASPVHIFHPELIFLQKKYAQKLIQLLGIGDDPMLAMVEIRNESSLASAWQAWSADEWSTSMQGAYADELTQQWNAWLVKTYGSVEMACALWKTCTHGLQALVTPAEADVLRTGQHNDFLGKVVDKVYALCNRFFAWLKMPVLHRQPSGNEQRIHDFVHFITDTDQYYLDTMKGAIRTVTVPTLAITGTQMSYGGALNFLSHRGMDYLDEHFYVDFYNFPNAQWDSHDWRIKDNSLTGTDMTTLVGLGRYRDPNRPYVISEFNQAYPNRQGAEMPPVVALIGALQDWDGLFQFDFSNGDDWGVLPSAFRLSGDWAKLAVTGQAAQIFRSNWVSPLTTLSATVLNQNDLLHLGALRQREGRGMILATASPRTPEGIFQTRIGTTLETSMSTVPTASALPTLVHSVAPAATQISYSEEERRLVFAAPQFAGFAGAYAPGQRIQTGDFTLEPLDVKRGFATVVITSLDGLPIAQSAKMLVALPGHVMGSQPDVMPPRPKKLIAYENSREWMTLEPDPANRTKPSGPRDAIGPVWMERVPLKLTFKTTANGLQVFPLSLTGKRLAALPAKFIHRVSDGYQLDLQMETMPESPWYEIAVNLSTDLK